MLSRKSKGNNWLMLGSVMVGGFLLGSSYNKYGKDITERIQHMSFPRRKYNYDDGYSTNHEPDA